MTMTHHVTRVCRVKIPLIVNKEQIKFAAGRVPDTVEADRRYMIDAAIVRIMKVLRPRPPGVTVTVTVTVTVH
jgi:hypothetical protein